MTPSRNGRTTSTPSGDRPTSSSAAWPMPITSEWRPPSKLRAIIVGSLKTKPLPLSQTTVLAVPRSMLTPSTQPSP